MRAIVSLGHSLGHEVVAEVVETLKEFRFLRHEGCDVMQGYLFSRPMTAEALAAWQQFRVAESLDQRAAGIENRLRISRPRSPALIGIKDGLSPGCMLSVNAGWRHARRTSDDDCCD